MPSWPRALRATLPGCTYTTLIEPPPNIATIRPFVLLVRSHFKTHVFPIRAKLFHNIRRIRKYLGFLGFADRKDDPSVRVKEFRPLTESVNQRDRHFEQGDVRTLLGIAVPLSGAYIAETVMPLGNAALHENSTGPAF